MSLFFRLTLLACLSLFLHACAHQPCPSPSEGARPIPGARGMIEFKPEDWKPGETTWWKDSDGIDPGVAGCHIGTDDKGVPNGRKFGEACLANGLLVESNPGKDELHGHKNDLGHPDTFDCTGWCKAGGRETGVCEKAPAPPCDSSARCVCE